MGITVFANVFLPNAVIAAGVRGKNIRLNSRVETDSGHRSVNVIWSKTLRQYELGTVPLRLDQWQAIETLHEITEGGAYGFLMTDPKDSAVANGVLTRISAGVYQLVKRYSDAGSGRSKDRNITRPNPTGFVLTNNGVPMVAGTYTLNADTGRVTISSDPAPETLSWSGAFYVPVHFMDDFIDWDMVISGGAEQRYLAGPSVVLQEVRE